jgi:hypothetical protein
MSRNAARAGNVVSVRLDLDNIIARSEFMRRADHGLGKEKGD